MGAETCIVGHRAHLVWHFACIDGQGTAWLAAKHARGAGLIPPAPP
jgi:hypothetical protein